jgi:hypothetical protein
MLLLSSMRFYPGPRIRGMSDHVALFHEALIIIFPSSEKLGDYSQCATTPCLRWSMALSSSLKLALLPPKRSAFTTNNYSIRIRAVHAGTKTLSPEVSFQLAEHSRRGIPKTAAEVRVLRLIAEGHSNKRLRRFSR